MRYLALALALALAASPALADTGDVMLPVPAARVQECNDAGGCALLSKSEVAVLMQKAYVMGAQAAAEQLAESLDSHGCRKDQT